MADTAISVNHKSMVGETVDPGCTKSLETTVNYIKETFSTGDSVLNNNHDNQSTLVVQEQSLTASLPSDSASNDRNHQNTSDPNTPPDHQVVDATDNSSVSESSNICNNELVQETEISKSENIIPPSCLPDEELLKNSTAIQPSESNISSGNNVRETNDQEPEQESLKTPSSELDNQTPKQIDNTVPEDLHQETQNATPPVLPPTEIPSADDIQMQHSKEPAKTQPVLLSESTGDPAPAVELDTEQSKDVETKDTSPSDEGTGNAQIVPSTEQSKDLVETKDSTCPSDEGTGSTQTEETVETISSENDSKPKPEECTDNVIDLSIKESTETKAALELSQEISKPEADKVIIDIANKKSQEVESVSENHVTPPPEKVVMDLPSKEIHSESTRPESNSQSTPPLTATDTDMGHPNVTEEQPLEMEAQTPSSSDVGSDATKETNCLSEMEVINDIPQTSKESNIVLPSKLTPSKLTVKVKKLNFTESQIAQVETFSSETDKTSASEAMDAESEIEEPPKKRTKSDEDASVDMLQNLSSGKYVFKLSEREKSNKLFHLQFNCASNKYIRVSDYNWEINGWESAVFANNNVIRKEEHDWQMVYLSRDEGTQSATIEWRFDFRNDVSLLVDRVRLKATSWTKYSGHVTWSVRCCSPGSSEDVMVPFPMKAGEQTVPLPKLKGCHMIGLRAQLSGGRGDVNWQHAQLFRTGLRDYIGCQFEIMVHLKGELWQIEKVLHGKYIKGKLHYLVKWKGYSVKDNTWEPEEHLNAMTRKHIAEHPVRITGKAPVGKRKSGARK